MRSRAVSVCAIVIGAVILLLAILAGFVNVQAVDGRRFAQHVNAVRQDPIVAGQLGQAIARRTLELNPDLVALRPLLVAAATSVASSDAFSPVVEATARQLHQHFTHRSPGALTVRLADAGSVLGAVLPAVAPGHAMRIPVGMDVTLARIGDQTTAARTIRLAGLAWLFAWLLPLLALLAFAVGVVSAPDRVRGVARVGMAIVATGAAIVLIWLAISLTVGSLDASSTLRDAVVVAGWHQVDGSLLWVAAVTATGGAVLVAAANSWIPEGNLGQLADRLRRLVVLRPTSAAAGIVRICVLLGLGLGLVARPATMLTFGAVAGGWVLLFVGVGELSTLTGFRQRDEPTPGRLRRRWRPIVAGSVSALALVGLLVVLAIPQDRDLSTLTLSSSNTCNGSAALCSRPYNDVAYAATHNSMTAANEPSWFIPEQPNGLVGQLNSGVRALLIDTWYGQRTDRRFRVATAPRSFEAALAETRATFGEDVTRSALRLHESFTGRRGPVRPYLCHGLCEIGATAFEPAMERVRAWMQGNPREVVTIIIQDMVTPKDTVAVIRRAGLLPDVFTPNPGEPWPTLGQMIDSGRRLVVMMENRGGGPAAPWLVPAFDWVQDTPYTNPTLADLSCEPNRGSPDNPLFLVNNWLSGFSTLVTSARRANAFAQLWPYVERCRRERGQIPNYVAVNYYNEGDLFRVVDRLNGLR